MIETTMCVCKSYQKLGKFGFNDAYARPMKVSVG